MALATGRWTRDGRGLLGLGGASTIEGEADRLMGRGSSRREKERKMNFSRVEKKEERQGRERKKIHEVEKELWRLSQRYSDEEGRG